MACTQHLVGGPVLNRRVSYGPDHPEVATALNNLAVLLEPTNRLAEADELLFRRVFRGKF